MPLMATLNGPANNPLNNIKPQCSPPAALFSVKPHHTIQCLTEDDLYALPSLQSTIYLVQLFFRDYGSMNPFLNETNFPQTHVFPIFKERRTYPSRTALLNVILAIATVSSVDVAEPVSRRMSLSKRFYQRAKGLLYNDAFSCKDAEQGKPAPKLW